MHPRWFEVYCFGYYLAVLAVLLTQHLKESLITFMESDNIFSRDM
jgi:hypothetical protein